MHTPADLHALAAASHERIGALKQRLNDCGPRGNRSVEATLDREEGRAALLDELISGGAVAVLGADEVRLVVKAMPWLSNAMPDVGAPSYAPTEAHYQMDDLLERLGAQRLLGPRPVATVAAHPIS